jgi:hypothetical protein
MSEAAIFAFGSVLFVITTWATIAYGLASIHELRLKDLGTNPSIQVRPTGQFTEVHVRSGADEPATTTTPITPPEKDRQP